MKAVVNLKKSEYNFNSDDHPGRFWDSDHDKITNFLDQNTADGKTTNFQKIIESGDQKILEIALSFKTNIAEYDRVLIDQFHPSKANQILHAEETRKSTVSEKQKLSWGWVRNSEKKLSGKSKER
jgi:hypothetical protein